MKRHVYFVSYQGITKDGGQFFGDGVQWSAEPITTWEHLNEIRKGLMEALRQDVSDVTNCIILNWRLLSVED